MSLESCLDKAKLYNSEKFTAGVVFMKLGSRLQRQSFEIGLNLAGYFRSIDDRVEMT